MGTSIKRLPPELAPFCDYMRKMSDFSSSFTDIAQLLPLVLVSDGLIVEDYHGPVCNGKAPWTPALSMCYKKKSGYISGDKTLIPGTVETEDNLV